MYLKCIIFLPYLGVVAVSWYPPGQADDNGQPFDGLIPLILDAAQANGVQVRRKIHVSYSYCGFKSGRS